MQWIRLYAILRTLQPQYSFLHHPLEILSHLHTRNLLFQHPHSMNNMSIPSRNLIRQTQRPQSLEILPYTINIPPLK